jgi:hypothetical protein
MYPLYPLSACEERKRALLAEIEAAIADAQATIERCHELREESRRARRELGLRLEAAAWWLGCAAADRPASPEGRAPWS